MRGCRTSRQITSRARAHASVSVKDRRSEVSPPDHGLVDPGDRQIQSQVDAIRIRRGKVTMSGSLTITYDLRPLWIFGGAASITRRSAANGSRYSRGARKDDKFHSSVDTRRRQHSLVVETLTAASRIFRIRSLLRMRVDRKNALRCITHCVAINAIRRSISSRGTPGIHTGTRAPHLAEA